MGDLIKAIGGLIGAFGFDISDGIMNSIFDVVSALGNLFGK